jgi:hypothetical protein
MTPPTKPIAVIGYGIAGQLLVLELLTKRNVPPSQIVILDENFLGGALATHYGSVLSNTPWSKTRQALAEYLPWSKEAIEKGDKTYGEAQCMPVRDIAKLCLQASLKASSEVEKITTRVTDLVYKDGQGWEIDHTFGKLTAKYVFLAHGAIEKQLNLDKPHIPLSIALNKDLLQNHLDPEKDIVAVFGLAHSGTILLNHLRELGVQTYGIYNTDQPFLFARDNVYDGIKEGAETIADSILRGEHATTTTLIPWSDPLALYKALTKATKVIYSIGFAPAKLGSLDCRYDPATGRIGTNQNLYGYGIAFPGTTMHNGKSYVDVSVLSFQDQIRGTLPQSFTL